MSSVGEWVCVSSGGCVVAYLHCLDIVALDDVDLERDGSHLDCFLAQRP